MKHLSVVQKYEIQAYCQTRKKQKYVVATIEQQHASPLL
jgi:hypothetical protein